MVKVPVFAIVYCKLVPAAVLVLPPLPLLVLPPLPLLGLGRGGR
jgi:hypothetical protein